MNAKIVVLLGAFILASCTQRTADDIGAQTAGALEAGDERAETPASQHGTAKMASAFEVLSAEHRSLIALSEAEAAWLDRNGYPTEAELERIEALDLDALEAAMRNRRDGKSAALVGARRLHEGDLMGAISAFARGSELGSLYARQELAFAELIAATGLPRESLHEVVDQASLGTFVAQMKVAQIMGDHQAKANVARYASNFDWSANSQTVLSQVVESMRQYSADAALRGVRAPGPDMRPNADEWLRLQKDPSAHVNIHRRQ